jgi:rRNA processing protein Krr1/Pno1
MDKKYTCAKSLLSDVYQTYKKYKKEAFSVIIFVPEGMVSLLIGAKGHQINKIMKESHTTIVVNQPINRMTYRTAKIQGYHSDIAKACRIIYEMLEEKSSIAYSIEKEPSQLDYTKSKIKSKFIFLDQVVSFLEKKKKRLLQRIEEETHCSIRFEADRDNRLLKKEEAVCVMNGRLEDVQAMVVFLINICHDFLSEDKRNVDYTLKMLIPANYVTKLIGQSTSSSTQKAT